MPLASILQHYRDAFLAKYASRLLPSHRKALYALLQCRTPEAGELQLRCPNCRQSASQPRSCGCLAVVLNVKIRRFPGGSTGSTPNYYRSSIFW